MVDNDPLCLQLHFFFSFHGTAIFEANLHDLIHALIKAALSICLNNVRLKQQHFNTQVSAVVLINFFSFDFIIDLFENS